MKKYSLNKNWEYVEAALQNPLLVNLLQGWKKTDLPHDYAVEKGRDLNSPAGLDEGFFQGAGLYYKKSFVLSSAAENKQLYVEFEGVSGFTEVWINKVFAGKHMNPYTSFVIDASCLLHPGENEIMLHTDSRMKPNSRWYVGAGLYRSVSLYIGEKGCIRPHGLKCDTVSLNAREAVLRLRSGAEEKVLYELLDGGNVIATAVGIGETRMTVPDPLPWSPDSPHLYTLRATVNGDTIEETVGIRTIETDSQSGLRLNGIPIKLKGGCIHHDLGILGAADYIAAEKRRIRILKESGFNAVRLAHNPFGPAIFQACDELGMLCVEEAFDEWVLGRTSFGLHITFEDRWERDLEDMIDRDYNHPCILMWSTGNEVEERDGSADGFAWSGKLAAKVRQLDSTRPVTASACALFSEYGQRPADGTTGNQALNMAFDNFASGHDIWGDATAPYFAPLDVAGYNYKSVRYAHDRKRFPDRVIYGSESYPRATYQTWRDTLANQNVIGDFVWTAWDYLGEVGVGRWEVSDSDRPSSPEWPWMTADCADIDLIGQKRPQSYYRDVVWGDDPAPHLFVLPPQLTGKKIARLSWGWLPVKHHYTFDEVGAPVEAHIYTSADEVELILNGRSLGKKTVIECQAVFELSYEPGTLTAVAYRDGIEQGREELVTAGETTKLEMLADRNEIRGDGDDLCFVTFRAQDSKGTPVCSESGSITVTVQGAKLIALGSADPKPERLKPFSEQRCPLYEGMAMAVVRSTEGSRGCVVKADLNGITAELNVNFTPGESATDSVVTESAAGAMDLTLGELLESPKAAAVLEKHLHDMLNNPLLDAMKPMSLKKLLSMSAQNISKELTDELNHAIGKGRI